MSVTLLLCAQDIRELHIAQIKEGEIVRQADYAVPPEAYLKQIAQTFSQWGIALGEIKELIVVTGPGSFTASRVSVTIANTLAFSQGVKLRPVENKEQLAVPVLWEQVKDHLPESVSFILPSYDREATITQPKK
jgi:hypothetical protein